MQENVKDFFKKKVQIKLIERDEWHGKKGEEIFKAPLKVCADIDKHSFVYKIDIDDEKKIFPLKGEKVTEKEYLESRLGIKIDYDYIPGEAHELWSSSKAKIKLPKEGVILHMINPLEHLKYRIALSAPEVANSKADININPDAEFYIQDLDAELEKKSVGIELRNKAIVKAHDASDEMKIHIIMILRGDNLQGKSSNIINTKLSEIIEKDSKKVLELFEKDKQYLKIKAATEKMIGEGSMIKEGINFKFMGAKIGTSIEEVIEFLMREENQTLLIKVLEQYRN